MVRQTIRSFLLGSIKKDEALRTIDPEGRQHWAQSTPTPSGVEGNPTLITLAAIVAEEVLERAYAWLCRRRQGYPPAADIWDFRYRWPHEKERLRAELVEGRYRVSLLTRVTLKTQEEIDLWAARDALVFKALSLVLAGHLPLSKHCTHLKGHGGSKGAVSQVLKQMGNHRFVLKTDIQSYYASIDHDRLLDRLAAYIQDRQVLHLIGQYLRRCAERGGLFWEYPKGIALGCPLSPIMGAFFLMELDVQLEQLGLFYVRFMDDVLVLAPTRWKLKKAVKIVNQVLVSLGLAKHPDKTFIGRIDKGFEFLGYHFRPGRLTVAQKTVERFVERTIRLYEQEPGEPCDSSRLGTYVQRWLRWIGAGLPKEAMRGVPGWRSWRIEVEGALPRSGLLPIPIPPASCISLCHRS